MANTSRTFPTHAYTSRHRTTRIIVGQPAAKMKEWIEDGLIVTNDNGTISKSEVRRFSREHGDLLV